MLFLRKILRIPISILILEKFFSVVKVGKKYEHWIYATIVWLSTYYYYCNVNYSYVPLGVVKGTVNPPCFSANATNNCRDSLVNCSSLDSPANCSGWDPFGDNRNRLLCVLYLASLLTYAFGMLVIGNISDYLDYRYVICIGSLITFTSSTLFGTGFYLNIHSFWYYLFSQLLLGVGAGCSPACIAILGKWFHGKRNGIILGLWSTSIPLLKLAGKLISSIWVDYTWGALFYSSSFIAATSGILLLLFVVPEPGYLETETKKSKPENGEATSKKEKSKDPVAKKPQGIRIWKAIFIPGVIEYSLVLFFISFGYYGFLLWLPYIFRVSEIEGVLYSTSKASLFSIAFYIGNMLGSCIGGGVANLIGSYSIVITFYIYSTAVLLYVYYVVYTLNLVANLFLLLLIGITMGGSYLTIFINVSVELGSKSALKNNARTTATVNGIIAFTGVIGGSIAGFIVGVPAVLYYLMASAIVAALLLSRITLKDCLKLYRKHLKTYVYKVDNYDPLKTQASAI